MNYLGIATTNLSKLDLKNCYAIDDNLCLSLVDGEKLLSNLQILILSGCKMITDHSIQLLCDSNHTEKLKILDISYLPLLTENTLEYLTNA